MNYCRIGIRLIKEITIVGTIAILCALAAKTGAAMPGSSIIDMTLCTSLTSSADESADDGAYSFHRPITSGTILLYQKLISPGRGVSCPMHPHCSQYGRQAFANYNPLRAYVMTADRLLRCGQDLNHYRPTSVDGHTRYSDPIGVDLSLGGRVMFAAMSGEYEPANDIGINVQSSDEPAVSSPGVADSLLFRFAHQLQQDGDYERAVTEYLRLVSYYPNTHYVAQARLAAVRCYYEAGLYSQAVANGTSVLSGRSDAATSDQIRFIVGASRFKSGMFESALYDFADLAEGDGDFREKGIMAQGLTHAHLLDWSAAARSFDAIDDASGFSMKARRCARLSREAADLGRKSPTVAGLLAVVPGLGYVYDGYHSTALSAFVVNGLFMWSTYEAFRQDHNGLGVTLAIFGMGWYAGNIYGSAYSAVRQNDKLRSDHLLKFDIGFKF